MRVSRSTHDTHKDFYYAALVVCRLDPVGERQAGKGSSVRSKRISLAMSLLTYNNGDKITFCL